MFKVGDRVQVLNTWGPPHNRKAELVDTVYEIASLRGSPFARLRPLPVNQQPSENAKKYARCCLHGGHDVHFSRLVIYAGELV
jgi:hypothetical protein